MDNNLGGDPAYHKGSNSCSPFWLTNIGLTWVNGINSRKRQRKDWIDEKSFQESMTKLKNEYEDSKRLLDTAFQLRIKEQQREYAVIQTDLKLDLDIQKDEVAMFIKGWPLKLSLQAVQEMRRNLKSLPEFLTVIIASHDNALGKGDPLRHIYDGNMGIVDNVKRVLTGLGISSGNILRFRDGDVPTGGAALANIFAMMSNLPVVMIMPRVDRANKKLIVSAGCWYPTSKIPMQRRIFELDYSEVRMTNDAGYLKEKQKEIETAYLAITGTSNDIYSLVAFGKTPRFAQFCVEEGLLESYPNIGEFIRNEYRSIFDSNQTTVRIGGVERNVLPIIFDDKNRTNIETQIKAVLNALS